VSARGLPTLHNGQQACIELAASTSLSATPVLIVECVKCSVQHLPQRADAQHSPFLQTGTHARMRYGYGQASLQDTHTLTRRVHRQTATRQVGVHGTSMGKCDRSAVRLACEVTVAPSHVASLMSMGLLAACPYDTQQLEHAQFDGAGYQKFLDEAVATVPLDVQRSAGTIIDAAATAAATAARRPTTWQQRQCCQTCYCTLQCCTAAAQQLAALRHWLAHLGRASAAVAAGVAGQHWRGGWCCTAASSCSTNISSHKGRGRSSTPLEALWASSASAPL
jgi:hypothetical protein